MEYNISEIIQVIAVFVSTVAVVIMTYCINKYGVNKVNKVMQTVRIAVNAIEQLGKVNGWDGKQKKIEALDYITKSLNAKGIKVKRTDLDMMIEAVVSEFNKKKPI